MDERLRYIGDDCLFYFFKIINKKLINNPHQLHIKIIQIITKTIMQKTKVIVVIGAPGVGKGTQCKIISQNIGMIHISTGDLCRDAVRLNTYIGRRVGEHLRNGDLVPDQLMIDVIEARLQQPDAIAHGVLLDGYPRSIKQAHALAQKPTINVERVILLQASNSICTDRILNRMIDPITGISYSLKCPELLCSNQEIKQRLVQRENDGDEPTINARLHYHHMNLGQVLQFFKGRIFAVNGDNSVNLVTNEMMKAISDQVIALVPENKPYNLRNKKPAEQQCAVCMSEPAKFLVVPCGHKCGCESCLSEIFGGVARKCPICRVRMDSFVQVFDSGIIDENEDEAEVAEQEEQYQFDLADESNAWRTADVFANQNAAVSAFERNMSDNLKVSISPCDNIGNSGKNNAIIAINISVPNIDIAQRVPVDVCCVIDISSSMAIDATFQDPDDETKTLTDGLTILDIVKHAIKTSIFTLTDQDRLAIVAFSGNASIVFPLTSMNEQGKKLAVVALEKLEPDGQTNIWAGLEAGLNALRIANGFNTGSAVPRKKNVFLLTDGQPNVTPPNGEELMLKQYLETYADLKCQIHTFGFGYTLKSDLLLNLATFGNGTNSFLPDAKTVGTCFVNSVANACSTFSQNCFVHLVLKGGASFCDVQTIGGLIPYQQTSWGKVVQLGPLQYGQTRDITVQMNIPATNEALHDKRIKLDSDYLEVTVEYESGTAGAPTNKVTTVGSNRNATTDSVIAFVRNHVVTDTFEVINKCSHNKGAEGVWLMKALVGQVTGYKAVNNDVRLAGLFEDVSGRMSKAISTVERFNRWGQHYLRSIVRAHQLQMCTNYLDTGLQHYGGSLFSTLKEQGGKIFLTLPLKKSRQESNNSYQRSNYQPAQTRSYVSALAPSNDTYFGGKKGCFDESCIVLVHGTNGQQNKTKISNVKRGDIVTVVDGNQLIETAVVQYVVKIPHGDDNSEDMVKFVNSGLMVTKKHPVKIDNKWQSPKDLVDDVDVVKCKSTTNYVYNLVLDRVQVALLVNNMECVTFGHYIVEAWHDFYATDKVVKTVKALASKQNNENGLVMV